MGYLKTTWRRGDKITVAKLNKMEQGIYDAQNNETPIEIPDVSVLKLYTAKIQNSNNLQITGSYTAESLYNIINSGRKVEIGISTYINNKSCYFFTDLSVITIEDSPTKTLYKFEFIDNDQTKKWISNYLEKNDEIIMYPESTIIDLECENVNVEDMADMFTTISIATGITPAQLYDLIQTSHKFKFTLHLVETYDEGDGDVTTYQFITDISAVKIINHSQGNILSYVFSMSCAPEGTVIQYTTGEIYSGPIIFNADN